MQKTNLSRRLVAFVGAFALALSLCAFSTPTVFAAENSVAKESVASTNQARAAGGYNSTGNAVSGQGNFTLRPTGYSSNAQLTVEAKNYTTTDIYVAVTSNSGSHRTIWAGFLNTSTMKNTHWFPMTNGETYNVYYNVINGSAVVAASLWSN